MLKKQVQKTLEAAQGTTGESATISFEGEWVLQIGSDIYAVSVIETLEGNVACNYVTSGIMSITKNGLSVKVNFGDGTCDDKATLIYPYGFEEEFTLKN